MGQQHCYLMPSWPRGQLLFKVEGGFATGTTNASSGWHMVGEKGPELLKMRGGEQVLSNADSKKALGGSNIQQNLYFTQSDLTPYDVARKSKKELNKLVGALI